MYAKLFTAVLLVSLQILFNEASVIKGTGNLVGEEASSTTRTPALPEGYVSFPDVHAAYKVHKEGTTWTVARDRCIAEGAHLAIADSVQKVMLINSLKPASDKWLHVGIYKLTDESTSWIRVDNGLPPSSIPWAKDHPDGDGNCAGISFFKNRLLSYACDWTNEWFVCEIPI